jgi:hypothetical protein
MEMQLKQIRVKAELTVDGPSEDVQCVERRGKMWASICGVGVV